MSNSKYICPRCGAFGMLVPDSEPIILSNMEMEIKSHEIKLDHHAGKLAEALRAALNGDDENWENKAEAALAQWKEAK